MSRLFVFEFLFALYMFGSVKANTGPTVQSDLLYPYGLAEGDGSLENVNSAPINAGKMPFFTNIHGVHFSEVDPRYVGDVRLTCEDAQSCEQRAWGYITVFGDVGGTEGPMYYRVTDDPSILSRASQDVRNINTYLWPAGSGSEDFRATKAFIATWHDHIEYGATPDPVTGSRPTNRFQLVLASDTEHTFAIMLYDKIEWKTALFGGNIRFTARPPHFAYTHPWSGTDQVLDMDIRTNSDQYGKWMYALHL